jgi:hypothetical protein
VIPATRVTHVGMIARRSAFRHEAGIPFSNDAIRPGVPSKYALWFVLRVSGNLAVVRLRRAPNLWYVQAYQASLVGTRACGASLGNERKRMHRRRTNPFRGFLDLVSEMNRIR